MSAVEAPPTSDVKVRFQFEGETVGGPRQFVSELAGAGQLWKLDEAQRALHTTERLFTLARLVAAAGTDEANDTTPVSHQLDVVRLQMSSPVDIMIALPPILAAPRVVRALIEIAMYTYSSRVMILTHRAEQDTALAKAVLAKRVADDRLLDYTSRTLLQEPTIVPNQVEVLLPTDTTDYES